MPFATQFSLILGIQGTPQVVLSKTGELSFVPHHSTLIDFSVTPGDMAQFTVNEVSYAYASGTMLVQSSMSSDDEETFDSVLNSFRRAGWTERQLVRAPMLVTSGDEPDA